MSSEQNKIVNIEDRIPKLKEHRKKKANRRLLLYMSIFFLLILLTIYLQSPYSEIKKITIKGNYYVNEGLIIQKSGLHSGKNMWGFQATFIEKRVNEIPYIETTTVSRKLPNEIRIIVKEFEPTAYIKGDKGFIPVLQNGETLPSISNRSLKLDAPIIVGFNEKKEDVPLVAEQITKLPTTINRRVSEIHRIEVNGQVLLKVYTTDQLIVIAPFSDFAEKMMLYPSIIKQITPGEKGIIHLEVSPYFEAIPPEGSENE
ncbi:cell division protein FtsQ/DivIB [Massilibacterium senegalense]|uniref:cell division protein FtsQ/DivIB n=1 Tax=Massilibacterium senegalense TaxID=1632858 RepID=UPI0007861CD7|nr:FtsQ-type POTRA domain-containing protein [Massilibacterium senegalense]